MCGAPLQIFRPTSLWLSFLSLSLARTLSSLFLFLLLSFFLYLASKFLPLLFLLLPFPFPFPSSPPPAPYSYKHSDLFTFTHNSHRNRCRIGDGSNRSLSKPRHKGGRCRISKRQTMLFIARRPVRECKVCPCISDLLRAIKLLFFSWILFFVFFLFVHWTVLNTICTIKFCITIYEKNDLSRISNHLPSLDSPTDPNRSIGHSALRLKGDSISASNTFRNISCVSVESSGCVFTRTVWTVYELHSIHYRFFGIFLYKYCMCCVNENRWIYFLFINYIIY